MMSDLELLGSWRAGDERAGRALFERHFDAMFRFFRSKVEHGAEDLVQQTFLACVENRSAFRGDSSFRTYLYTVARSRLIDAFRKQRRTPEGVDLAEMSVADLRTSPSTWLSQKDKQRLLIDALERLPLDLHLSIELFYFEDLSAREVSLILEIPEGTVRSRIRRALAQLKAEVEKLAEGADATHQTLSTLDGLLAQKPLSIDTSEDCGTGD